MPYADYNLYLPYLSFIIFYLNCIILLNLFSFVLYVQHFVTALQKVFSLYAGFTVILYYLCVSIALSITLYCFEICYTNENIITGKT